MAGNNSIQFVRGTSTQRATHTETSLIGQPIFETDTNKLYVGDGTTLVKNLDAINAGNADHATNANHATTADSATNANHATSADHAKTANSAARATNASYATSADHAEIADLATKASNATYATGNNTKTIDARLSSLEELNYWDLVEKGFITPSIGETKTIKISGTEYKIQCIGLNHDDLVSGGKAKTTWQLVDCYTTREMNANLSNAGGWKDSYIRTWLNMGSTSIRVKITDEDNNSLESKIKQVVKRTANGGSQSGTAVVTTNDYLFLPSVTEVFGTTYQNSSSAQFAYAGEGNQYEFYSGAPIPEPTNATGRFTPLKEHSSTGTFYTTTSTSFANGWINKYGSEIGTMSDVRYNYNCTKGTTGDTSSTTWWLRSPFKGNTVNFCTVENTASLNRASANTTLGESFCFCI